MSSYDKNFLIDSIALFRGDKSSHMGAQQYSEHKATRHGKPMSGVILWDEITRERDAYYMPRIEKAMLAKISTEIAEHVPMATPFIDLGPGTLETIEIKSLPIIQALRSSVYIPIDISVKFCSEAGTMVQKHVPGTEIIPSLIDFFSKDADAAYTEPGLALLGGITITNIEAPLSKELPRKQLIKHLRTLAKITGGGWLLVSTDNNQNEAENRAMYFENALFELNHIFRMAEELPMQGLDPYAFEYDPYWIPESSQLAHTAIATRNMHIDVKSEYITTEIDIKANTRFHLKNSFKFTDEFFSDCAEDAGFTVLKMWTNEERPIRFFLLRATEIAETLENSVSTTRLIA